MSVVTLFYGIFLLLVLLLFAGTILGGGVGTPELGLWLLLLVGWVSFWMVKRQR